MTELARAHQDRLMQYIAYGFLVTCLLSLLVTDRRDAPRDSGDTIVSTEETRPAAPDELADDTPAPAPVPQETRSEPLEAEPVETPRAPAPASEADLRIIDRALRATMRTYRDEGMTGLNVAIGQCYDRALELRTLAALEYCFILDDGAAGIEAAFADSVHVAPSRLNSRDAVDGRIASVWQQLDLSDMELAERKDEWRQLETRQLNRIIAQQDAAHTGYVYDDGAPAAALQRKAGAGVDPAEPVRVQRAAVVQMMTAGTLPHAAAEVQTFRSLAEARRAAARLSGGLSVAQSAIVEALDRRLVVGALPDALRTGDARTFLYLGNPTSTPVGAFIIDIADRPCSQKVRAGHAYHLVSRRDGTPLDAQDDIALVTPVPITPGDTMHHCQEVVGVVPPRSSYNKPVDAASAAAEATAMTFTLHVRDYRPMKGLTSWIFADGDITDDTPRAFEAFVQQAGLEPGSRVILNSPGGKMTGGMDLGDTIRRLGFQTDIGRREGTGRATRIVDGECDSACSLAYLGGTFRHLHPGSRYGVHRFWFGGTPEKAVEAGQLMSAKVLTYVTRLGASPDLAARMAETSSDEIDHIPLGELMALRVVTGGVASESWSLDTANGRIYVAGLRRDQQGTQKFMLLCKREANQLIATAVTGFADADTAGRFAVASGTGVYVDDTLVPLHGATPSLTLRDQSVWAQWPLRPEDVDALLGAKTSIGFALQQPGNLVAGFHIALGDGRKLIRDYAKDCFRH